MCGGSGFLLSAASLGNYPQPLAMGLILAMSGWHAAVMSLGAMLGYWVFWGIAGLQGLVWSASGGLLALLLARHIPEEQPLIFPAISAFLTALTGLLFQLVLRDTVPVPVYFLRIVLAAGAGLLFPVALVGLGLDLAQVTNIPMTAVLCLAGVIRMIPFERKWMRCLAPGAACMVVMAICGIRDYTPLPGLILGGGLGILMPPSPETARRRGETGLAQVRLGPEQLPPAVVAGRIAAAKPAGSPMPQVGAADPRASPGAGAIKASESRQRPAVRVPGGDGAAVSVSGRFSATARR